MEEKKYPISEIFVSIQGEGIYQGTVMAFVRLAGCTVGKPYPRERYFPESARLLGFAPAPEHLPIYTEKCTLYDGREFPCDTDYRVKERLTAKEILERIPANVQRVCITGGEPLMHDITDLCEVLYSERNKLLHLETSGTIHFDRYPLWITVSPKFKVLPTMVDRADELKILVDKDFVPDQWIGIAVKKPVYLQPVNGEHTISAENLKLCRKWQDEYPQFRLSVQQHKVIEHYLNERVR